MNAQLQPSLVTDRTSAISLLPKPNGTITAPRNLTATDMPTEGASFTHLDRLELMVRRLTDRVEHLEKRIDKHTAVRLPQTTNANIAKATHLLDLVCQHYDINPNLVLSHARPVYVVKVRFLTCWIISKILALHSKDIGPIIRHDRGSVDHALKKINDWREIDQNFRRESDQLLAAMRENLHALTINQ